MRPGEPFTVGLRIQLDPGWHTYWQNPGDAGQPAAIDWRIPAGFRAGDFQWPYPRTVEDSTVVSYGYDDEVMLLTEIAPPRFMTTGHTVRFAAEVRWLVCKNICLPARASLEFELKLTDDQPAPVDRWESTFAEARSRIPLRTDEWELSAYSNDDSIVLQIVQSDVAGSSFEGAHFFASERGVIAHGAPQLVTQEAGVTRMILRKSRFLRAPVVRLKGVLVFTDKVDIEAVSTRSLVLETALSEPTADENDI